MASVHSLEEVYPEYKEMKRLEEEFKTEKAKYDILVACRKDWMEKHQAACSALEYWENQVEKLSQLPNSWERDRDLSQAERNLKNFQADVENWGNDVSMAESSIAAAQLKVIDARAAFGKYFRSVLK